MSSENTSRRSSGGLLRGTVADDLRRSIATGEMAPGAALPTEKELMARYGVSRNTVRNALSALENEGLITSSQGRGRQVRKREPVWIYASRSESRARRRPSGVDSWVDDMRNQNREARTDIEVTVVHAPVEVSERLNLDNGALVAVRRRIRFADDQPWNLNDSYYPMWIAEEIPAILDPADVTQGLTVYLADQGYSQVYYNDELTCRMPTPEESQALNIGVGIPVMCHTRTGITTDGPIRVTITVLPGDRHRLLYEVPS